MFYFLFWLGGSGSAVYRSCFRTVLLLRCAGFRVLSNQVCGRRALGRCRGRFSQGAVCSPAWCSPGAADAVLGVVCGRGITQRCRKALELLSGRALGSSQTARERSWCTARSAGRAESRQELAVAPSVAVGMLQQETG